MATEFEVAPAVDSETFLTDLPPGAEDASSPRIEDFRHRRVGGGEMARTD